MINYKFRDSGIPGIPIRPVGECQNFLPLLLRKCYKIHFIFLCSISRISRLSKDYSLWHTQRAQENQFCKVLYLGNKIALGLNASKLYFFWSPFQIAVDGRYEKICICWFLQALCICVFVNGFSLPLVTTGKDCSSAHF